MVTITDYKLRESFEGKAFFALTLQGGIEIVKSASGNSYATIKKASMPTTFDEITCKALVGTQLPGRIEKVETVPYEYTIQETGEVIMLSHRYDYFEEELEPINETMRVYETSNNGVHAGEV